jgi:(p)ppGpp synthase/HD superfamily hydrolase
VVPQQGREAAIVQGRESLERELRRLGIDRPRFEDYVALVPKISSVDDLLAAIGFGDIATTSVATKVLDAERALATAEAEAEAARLAALAPVPEPKKARKPRARPRPPAASASTASTACSATRPAAAPPCPATT